MRGINGARWPLLLGGLLIVGLAVSGCREEEQDRTLLFEKGTYLDKSDQKLTEEQNNELRHRADSQRN